MADPELELDLVFGPIDGAVGDREDLGLRCIRGRDCRPYQTPVKPEVGEAIGPALSVLGLAGGDQPLMVWLALVVAAQELAVLVGLGVEGRW